jgi:cellulose synthase/poly-beta-1,6-N-acetylglucosamine synthase-like glycosyltransferase
MIVAINTVEMLFWSMLAVLFFLYCGVEMLIIAVGRFHPRNVAKQPIYPTVSVIVAAHNEEENIARCIDGILGQDYPKGRVELIVASDGSTDDTEDIAESYDSCGVQVLRLPRGGKIAALNAAVAHSLGDILLFVDADVTLATDALRQLAGNFADPEVGGVAGGVRYLKTASFDSAVRGEDLYLRYEMWLKKCQTHTGSVVSSFGGLYAIRRHLYEQVPDGVSDDFVISSGVVEQGYRLVFEPNALGYVAAKKKAGQEFQRKIRIVLLGLAGVRLRRKLLNPTRYGFYSLMLWSQKILRRFVPVFLILLLAANLVLVHKGVFYVFLLVLQAAFYAVALIGFSLRKAGIGGSTVFCVPFFYCMVNLAALVALMKIATGHRTFFWEPRAVAK